MPFSLQQKVFDKFGAFYKLYDTYQDLDGKGILERYMEMFGKETDDSYYSFSHLDNAFLSASIKEELIVFLEETFGNLPKISESTTLRKRVLKFAIFLLQVKGTLQALITLLRWLGFTNVTIQDNLRNFGFDSDTTFDDEDRVFDSFLQGKDVYELTIYGNITLTAELLGFIYSLIKWNEPIDASISKITYFDIPAVIGDLPTYNAMVSNSHFEIIAGKLTQIFD